MTPKEKAQEIVFKIYETMFHVRDGYNSPEVSKAVKQCALITVDEILKSGCTLPSENAYYGDNEEASKYWEQVKQEIEAI